MILSCDKTGRWWRVADAAEAMRLARTLGLVTFFIAGSEAVDPAVPPDPAAGLGGRAAHAVEPSVRPGPGPEPE
ncbi:hypothetical protein [Oceanicella sp. SM1341]|uniref:hypothetical protein n=1 Tax=Oceanicella sp. SM1341 TaxID=1548889 RepID=UPI000E4A625D|nr:hypothetical protein [Oceanicella sp. SM1341]